MHPYSGGTWNPLRQASPEPTRQRDRVEMWRASSWTV